MKINVAIVAGGDSSEYQISVNSAEQVAMHLDKDKYNPTIVLLRGNHWMIKNNGPPEIKVDKNDFTCIIDGKPLHFDVVFNAIHGTPGEDGKLQSYFDMIGIPYTSSGAFSSSLSFNKYACKIYLKEMGILTARSFLIRKEKSWDKKLPGSGSFFPCFVKPNNGGSSFGVSRVVASDKLPEAIRKAFREDNEVIVEEFIEGTEVTCGLIKTEKKEIVFPLTEIVSKKDFFDYEAKYTAGMAEEITPGRIPEGVGKEIQNLSSGIYSYLNCKGIVRIDYMLSGDRPYFLEINTVPGLSAESIIPKQAKAYGIELMELYGLVIEDAILRKQVSR